MTFWAVLVVLLITLIVIVDYLFRHVDELNQEIDDLDTAVQNLKAEIIRTLRIDTAVEHLSRILRWRP